jgi:hypothetical protein
MKTAAEEAQAAPDEIARKLQFNDVCRIFSPAHIV